jgi:hypothetical protein
VSRVHILLEWRVNIRMGRELAPSSFVRRPSWYELTLMDAQKHEAPRSTDKERTPPKKCPYFMAQMCSIINSKTSSVQRATSTLVLCLTFRSRH